MTRLRILACLALQLLAAAPALAVPPNTAPILGNLDGDNLSWVEGGSPVLLDRGSDATVTDPDSPDFDGGSVIVSIVTNRVSSEDVLGIQNVGTGPGQIGFSGTDLTYGGSLIATFSGGSSTNDLVITLNTNSTPAAVQALIQALTYANTNDANPDTNSRGIQITVSDGDGGSASANVSVLITPVNDRPVVVAPIVDQAGVYGSHFSLNIAGTFSDPDGDSLTNSVTGLPPGLSLNSTNLTISGTPTNPGTFRVSLVAHDGQTPDLTATNTFNIVVDKASLLAVADDLSRSYAAVNPDLTITYSGFQAGDTVAVLTNEPVVSTTASNRSPVGTYPINLTGGSDYRYTFALSNGTLTITQALLRIRAEDKVKTFGAPNPALSLRYVGFAAGESESVLTSLPAVSTLATINSPPGDYAITVTGGSDDNYALILGNGTLTVRAAGVPRVRGTFYGLFFEPAGVRNDSSGSLTLTTTDGNKFSAVVRAQGRRHSYTGLFDVDGRATNEVLRPGNLPLTLELQLGTADGINQLGGRVTDGALVAELLADYAPYNASTNPAPQAGKYTVIIPGVDLGPDDPEGHSFAMVSVTKSGQVQFQTRLCDDTVASQGMFLTANGRWPCYLPLYSGGGCLIAWLAFTNTPTSDLAGQMNWLKPPVRGLKPYRFGFAVASDVYGARYTPPRGATARIIDLPIGNLVFDRGPVSPAITLQVELGTDDHLRDHLHHVLPVAILPGTGLFFGYFRNSTPFSQPDLKFMGIMVQKTNVAAGFFIGTSLTELRAGRMRLGP